MRVAKANELEENALPVLTARVSESELQEWFPFELHRMTHPQEVPEPSKAALAKLDTGDYFVLFWGEVSKQLMLRIPPTTDATDFLAAFFKEVPLPRRRILWRRSDARLPRHIAAKRIAVPSRAKKKETVLITAAARARRSPGFRRKRRRGSTGA